MLPCNFVSAPPLTRDFCSPVMRLVVRYSERKFIVVVPIEATFRDVKQEIVKVHSGISNSLESENVAELCDASGCVLFDDYKVNVLLSDMARVYAFKRGEENFLTRATTPQLYSTPVSQSNLPFFGGVNVSTITPPQYPWIGNDWSNVATGPSTSGSPMSFMPPPLEGQGPDVRSTVPTLESQRLNVPTTGLQRSNALPSSSAFTVVPRDTENMTPSAASVSNTSIPRKKGRHLGRRCNPLQRDGSHAYSTGLDLCNDLNNELGTHLPAAGSHGNRLDFSCGETSVAGGETPSGFVPGEAESGQESAHATAGKLSTSKNKRQKRKVNSSSKASSKRPTSPKKPKKRPRATVTRNSPGSRNTSFTYPGFSSDWSSSDTSTNSPLKKKSKAMTSNSPMAPQSNVSAAQDHGNGAGALVSMPALSNSAEKGNLNPSNGDSGFLSIARDESVGRAEQSLNMGGVSPAVGGAKQSPAVGGVKQSPAVGGAEQSPNVGGVKESQAAEGDDVSTSVVGDSTRDTSLLGSRCNEAQNTMDDFATLNSIQENATLEPSQPTSSSVDMASPEDASQSADPGAVLAFDSVPLSLLPSDHDEGDPVNHSEMNSDLTRIEESQDLGVGCGGDQSRSVSPVIPIQGSLATKDSAALPSNGVAMEKSVSDDTDRVDSSAASALNSSNLSTTPGPGMLPLLSFRPNVYDYTSDMSVNTDSGRCKKSTRRLKLFQRMKQSRKYQSRDDSTPAFRMCAGTATKEGKSPVRQYQLSHLNTLSLSSARFQKKRVRPIVPVRNRKSTAKQSDTKEKETVVASVGQTVAETPNNPPNPTTEPSEQLPVEESTLNDNYQTDPPTTAPDLGTENETSVEQTGTAGNALNDSDSDTDSSTDLPNDQKSLLDDKLTFPTVTLNKTVKQHSTSPTPLTAVASTTDKPHFSKNELSSDSDSESESVDTTTKKPLTTQQTDQQPLTTQQANDSSTSSWSSSDSEPANTEPANSKSKTVSKPDLLPVTKTLPVSKKVAKSSPSLKRGGTKATVGSLKKPPSVQGGKSGIASSDSSSDSDSSDTEVDSVKPAVKSSAPHKKLNSSVDATSLKKSSPAVKNTSFKKHSLSAKNSSLNKPSPSRSAKNTPHKKPSSSSRDNSPSRKSSDSSSDFSNDEECVPQLPGNSLKSGAESKKPATVQAVTPPAVVKATINRTKPQTSKFLFTSRPKSGKGEAFSKLAEKNSAELTDSTSGSSSSDTSDSGEDSNSLKVDKTSSLAALVKNSRSQQSLNSTPERKQLEKLFPPIKTKSFSSLNPLKFKVGKVKHNRSEHKLPKKVTTATRKEINEIPLSQQEVELARAGSRNLSVLLGNEKLWS